MDTSWRARIANATGLCVKPFPFSHSPLCIVAVYRDPLQNRDYDYRVSTLVDA